MSTLSGYDSEATGFDSASQSKRSESSNSTQTEQYQASSVASMTSFSQDAGLMTSPQDLGLEEVATNSAGLAEFLKKVVPSMLEQLEKNDKELDYNSSDSDEEELLVAKRIQDLKTTSGTPALGSGDHQAASILSLSWSSAGNSLAISLGQPFHDKWCEHQGLIRIYTMKRSAGDKLVHSLDISEKNCVTVVKYHPSVAAVLAYATTSGEVVICNLRDSGSFNGGQLTSPSGCHGSRTVTALHWADAMLANQFLTMQIQNTGKRRGAADQILISAGSDGSVNVWQVNADSKVFENVVCYTVNAGKKLGSPDISCLDFVKSYPLRPAEEKAEGVFVVGTHTGDLFLCKIKADQKLGNALDPVFDVLDGHNTCVLDLAFSLQRPNVLASLSIDSELRVYDIHQGSPLKVICLDAPVSCMCWLPNNPGVLVLGLDRGDALVKVYHAPSGRLVPVDGLDGSGGVTAIAVNQHGACSVAAGDSDGLLRVWEIPSRRIRLAPEDLEF